jgi:hypothetical protein
MVGQHTAAKRRAARSEVEKEENNKKHLSCVGDSKCSLTRRDDHPWTRKKLMMESPHYYYRERAYSFQQ